MFGNLTSLIFLVFLYRIIEVSCLRLQVLFVNPYLFEFLFFHHFLYIKVFFLSV
jgi:hypothetical protein